MKKPIKRVIDLSSLKNKVFILVIEDDGLSIKEIDDEAILIIPEQLIELVCDKYFICDQLAIQIYLALKNRLNA